MTDRDCRLSVIVPTFNRRAVLLDSIASVVAADRPWPCELIVVVDGSDDGTLEAVEALELPLPLTVLFQGNQGAAAARNAGASVARGDRLLFIDDDMTLDRSLLVEHDKALAAGADAAVGHFQLDPRSPRTVLTRGVRRWAEKRKQRLDANGGRLGIGDFLSGQLSVRADWFTRIGGFDQDLTAKGTFGGEDTDLVYRLMQAGARLRFIAEAVSHQRYVVTAAQNLRQWRQAGRADAALSVKHPALGATLFAGHRGHTAGGRVARALAATVPEAATEAVATRLVRRVDDGRLDRPTEWAFAGVRDVAYWRGARDNGGVRAATADTGVRILAYHAVEAVEDPRIGPYCVAPDVFADQLAAVVSAGQRFITADDLLEHLDGRPLAPGSVLLTFDDAYRSVLTEAKPVLDTYGATGVVCVVTGQLGGHNAWDTAHGAARLPLLTATELHNLRLTGWEIASHTERHTHLAALRGTALVADLRRSRDALADACRTPPRLIAYPYGEHNRRVRTAARAAGFDAALALTTHRPAPDAADRFAVPRVEVQRDTTPDRLVELLARPARTATPARIRRELRGVLR